MAVVGGLWVWVTGVAVRRNEDSGTLLCGTAFANTLFKICMFFSSSQFVILSPVVT
jgi:hypothetical protein